MIRHLSLISLSALAAVAVVLPLAAALGAEGPQAARDLALITRHFKENNRDVKPDFDGPGRPFVWVFYGDSITHGAVHTHGWRSFVEIFQERVRTDMDIYYDSFINSGDSGQDSGHLLRDWQYECQVRRHRPTVVSLMVGMNDADGRHTPEEFRANLRRLVKLIRADGAIPVLQTQNTIELYRTPDGSAPDRYWQGVINRYHNYPAFAQVIREVAAELDVILIDHHKYWSENAADPKVLYAWLGETMHPGPLGSLKMAELMMKKFSIYDPGSRCLRVDPPAGR